MVQLVQIVSIVLFSALFHYTISRWRKIEVSHSTRTVLITGAASGLGRALTQYLVETFGDVVIALDNNRGLLDELQAWALENKHEVECIFCDVGDVASVAKAVKTLEAVRRVRAREDARYRDCLHAIVNLAGIYGCGPLMEKSTVDKVEHVLRTNTIGAARVNQAFHHLLPKSSSSPADDARILMAGSEMSDVRVATGLTAPYTMSKWALEAYVVSLRQELRCMLDEAMPVHVCMVSIGAARTPLMMQQPIEQAHKLVLAGSRWSAALRRLVDALQTFEQHFAVGSPEVAPMMAEIVHAVEPPYRHTINSMWPLQIARWVPQWLLDRQAKKKRLGKVLVAGMLGLSDKT